MKGKLYEDGDPRAQVLVATPGDELESKPVVEKALHPIEDKAVKPSENKDRGSNPSREKRSGAQSSREAPEPFPPLDEEDSES